MINTLGKEITKLNAEEAALQKAMAEATSIR
jgi:hypothetical protein